MSLQCTIHCYNCNNDYHLYSRQIQHDKPVDCPHCFTKIDETVWNDLVNAVLSLDEVNYHFRKYHAERHEPLFDVSMKNIHVTEDKINVQ